jgi:hypothetical protein
MVVAVSVTVAVATVPTAVISGMDTATVDVIVENVDVPGIMFDIVGVSVAAKRKESSRSGQLRWDVVSKVMDSSWGWNKLGGRFRHKGSLLARS